MAIRWEGRRYRSSEAAKVAWERIEAALTRDRPGTHSISVRLVEVTADGRLPTVVVAVDEDSYVIPWGDDGTEMVVDDATKDMLWTRHLQRVAEKMGYSKSGLGKRADVIVRHGDDAQGYLWPDGSIRPERP